MNQVTTGKNNWRGTKTAHSAVRNGQAGDP
jgi:hypothetical protein